MCARLSVLATLRLPKPSARPALAQGMECGPRGWQPEAHRRSNRRSHGGCCAHHRGGRRDSRCAAHRCCGSGGDGVKAHRRKCIGGCLFGLGGCHCGRGGFPLRLPRGRQERLLLLLHRPQCLFHAHLLLLARGLLHSRNLVLAAIPDLTLGAQVAMTALSAVLATARLVEPSARTALPRTVKIRARRGQVDGLFPRGQREHHLRGLRLRVQLNLRRIGALVVIILLIDVFEQRVRRT
mmetsp:Transcript_49027/g.140925  ORF Transcript_49027/g.140925 Transcript_49027/m.140925 type:complete len:238 (-) Transcript_49027:1187-1900(-)